MGILQTIVDLSHEFGTTQYVQGGGGNSSAKNNDTIWVKPSGTTLIGLQPEQLLELDRRKVARMYEIVPPDDVDEREALVTRMLAESRKNLDDPRRPSVESPLHDSFSATYVIHTHPQNVGGLVCATRSAQECARLFPDYLYLEAADPGYTMSMQSREALAEYTAEHGHQPAAVFMENHGLFVAGNAAEDVRAIFKNIDDTLNAVYDEAGLSRTLDIGPDPDGAYVRDVVREVRAACGDEHAAFHTASGTFPVPGDAISPDHIVYMKSYCFVGEPSQAALRAFEEARGYAPRVLATDRAVVCVGTTQKNADLAMLLAKDGAIVEQLAPAFGGIRYMAPDRRVFVENWEAEVYRQKVAGGTGV